MWINALSIVTASSGQQLVVEIEKSLKQLQQDIPEAMLVGVSHDVMVDIHGVYIWTALITCEYFKPEENNAEDSTPDQG